MSSQRLTEQEVLDQVKQYFITEHHQPGRHPRGVCLYTGPCAIGIFMPEDLREWADDEMMGAAEIGKLVPELRGIPASFLEELQEAHDASSEAYADVETADGDRQPEFERELGKSLVTLANAKGLVYLE